MSKCPYVRLASDKKRESVFRYRTSRHYYRLALEGGTHLRLAVRLPFDQEFRVASWREVASVPFVYDTRTWYRMDVSAEGERLRASIDGKPLVDVRDRELTAGLAGITANMPARFRSFRVSATAASASEIRARTAKRTQELEGLRAGNPKPVLLRKFDTPGFGAGRNVRFGDLDGDGRLDMLLAQNVAKVRGDAFDQISCLTAVTLEGRVLWQQGRPNPKNALLTNDNPFQIHDLDGDGRAEVVVARDFQLQVLDGRTGALVRKTWLPPFAADLKDRPVRVERGRFAVVPGPDRKGTPREILLKDRYRGFWIFDKDLELLWQGEGQTGHYPYPFDVDRDGRQEFLIGYSLWGADGKRRWTHDANLHDHADALAIGNFTGRLSAGVRAYIDGSDEGFLVFEADGTLVKHLRLGHAQTQSVGKYRPDLPGLQILIATFWRNPGIVTALDADANILAQEEMIPGSSHLEPVNWRGDGQEFALLSANVREGGMIDGHFRRVVMFPDDGHPDLASAVRDVAVMPATKIGVGQHARVDLHPTGRSRGRSYRPIPQPSFQRLELSLERVGPLGCSMADDRGKSTVARRRPRSAVEPLVTVTDCIMDQLVARKAGVVRPLGNRSEVYLTWCL